MPGGDLLDSVRNDAFSLTADEFVERYPIPCVICYTTVAAASGSSFATTQISAIELRAVLKAPLADLHVLPSLESKRSMDRLYFLRKSAPGAFKNMVTVGRTRMSDIPLVSEKVSKLHAYFTWSPSLDAFYITDKSSTNGTIVDSKVIKPNEPTPLKDMTDIRVGDFQLVFLTPASLYRVLNSAKE